MIQAPTNCPACGSELELKGADYFCVNKQCSGQLQKRLEHFCKTMKIKGLGPKTVEKLQLESIHELYELDEEELSDRIGSKTLATKIYKEVANSTDNELDVILAAMSIPHIGLNTARKVANQIGTISNLSEGACAEAGLGPVATQSLMTWYETEFPEIKNLPFTFAKKVKTNRQKECKGVVCISGKLTSYKTKAEAQKVLEEAGYVVKPSLTKEVTILVNESGIESSKTSKARERGITIINSIFEILGE